MHRCNKGCFIAALVDYSKSSLFALLLDHLQADAGDIRGLKGLRISHMAQETETSDLIARDYVIAGDEALYQVLQDLATADAAGEYEQSATLHQRMEEVSSADPMCRMPTLQSTATVGSQQ